MVHVAGRPVAFLLFFVPEYLPQVVREIAREGANTGALATSLDPVAPIEVGIGFQFVSGDHIGDLGQKSLTRRGVGNAKFTPANETPRGDVAVTADLDHRRLAVSRRALNSSRWQCRCSEGVALPDYERCACTRGTDKEHARLFYLVLDALKLRAVRQQQNDVARLATLARVNRPNDRSVKAVLGESQLDRGPGLTKAPPQPLHVDGAVLASCNAHEVPPGFARPVLWCRHVLDARRPEVEKASLGEKWVYEVRETDRQPCRKRYPES